MTSLVAVWPAIKDTVVVVAAVVVVVVGDVSPNLPGERVFSSAAYETNGVVDEILMMVFEM